MEDNEEGRYMVEVTGLSSRTRHADIYQFFLNCGEIKNLEVVCLNDESAVAYVEFEEAYSVKIALFLSGSEIVDDPVIITSCGTYHIDPSPFVFELGEKEGVNNSLTMHSNKLVSTRGEAVTVVQEVVHTMISRGYVLSKDALSKAKAFDESHHISSSAAAKLAELSKRIGLTDKIYSGMETVKSVDEKYHVYETTKSVASYTGKTAAAAAAATAVVNSSYFAKGALWVSGVLDRAAKAAADLGNRGDQN